jgi:hypothetical protein
VPKIISAGFALALAAPIAALADPASDIEALRRDIATLRADYEARIRALEQRLKTAEAAGAPPGPAAAAAGPAATPAAAPGLPATAAASSSPPKPPAAAGPAPAPVAVATRGDSASSFNPAISLILSGQYARTSQDPANYAITGIPLPADAEVGPGTRGFSLNETELTFSASIDPWLRGAATIAVEPDNSVGVEEAFIQTTALGHGLALKAGRYFSALGYLNSQHRHTWDFVDAPLAYQAFLGTQFSDDGLQFQWLAPTDTYIELGLEVGRGRGFPGSDSSRNGAGAWVLTAHTGGDIGVSNSWRAGLSYLDAKADELDFVQDDAFGSTVTNAFSGRTKVWVADAVWKWAPNGNATRTNFKLQGEYIYSRRDGSLAYDVEQTDSLGDYSVNQSGWYLQGIYQFMPRWRVGLRTERLDTGSPDYGANAGLLAGTDYNPRKNTLLLEFSPSEFSRIRLQYARDRARMGVVDNQWFLQYQASLGAHGAHGY